MDSVEGILPFNDLVNSELNELITNVVPPISNYENIYFSPAQLDERDSELSPERILLTNAHDFSSNYFDFDQHLLQNLGRNDEQSISLVSLNISSVPKHLDKFVADFIDCSLDVIGMCETRLNVDLEPLYTLPSYNTFFNSRNTQGGGTLLHICEKMKSSELTNLTLTLPYFESVFVLVQLSGKKLIIGNIYRPPNSDINSFLSKLFEVLTSIMQLDSSCSSIIMGDINIDLLKVSTNARYMEYYTIMTSFNYCPLIRRPTRVTDETQTLIDHIWTNEPHTIFNSGIVSYDLSDHFPVFAVIEQNIAVPHNESQYVTMSKRLNNEVCDAKFRDILNSTDFSDVNDAATVDDMYNKFSVKLCNAYNDAYPCIEIRRRKIDLLKPYINADLRSLIREKHRIHRLYRRFPYTYGTQYKRLKNKVNKAISKAKKVYYSTKFSCCAGDPKKTWSILNEVMGRNKNDSVTELKIDDEKITGDQCIAEHFNEFFSNIGTSISSGFTNDESYAHFLTENLSHDSFSFCEVSLSELHVIMGGLKLSSAGHDNIPLSLLCKNIDLLGVNILSICNRSLAEGVFPNSLKVAKVIPIFKTGERESLNNYRPISVLPSFSKILEKIVYIQLINYFNYYNLLTPAQFGFRAGFSTSDALHNFLDYVYRAMDNLEFTVCILLDLSKAFDTLNRDILIKKLEYYGIQGVAKLWFVSYLTNREQFTQIRNSRSAKLPIISGVAQGSIIAPLLFIIYINDVVRSSRILRYVLYADDTSVFLSSKNLNSLIDTVNSEMRKVQAWFEANQLLLNSNKTSYMIFHRRRHLPSVLPSIVVNENVINRVENCRFLGIMVDDHITFKKHVELTLGKLAKELYIFLQNSQFRSHQRTCANLLLASLSSFNLWRECVVWLLRNYAETFKNFAEQTDARNSWR